MKQVLVTEICRERPNAVALGGFNAALIKGYNQGLKMKLNTNITLSAAKDLYSNSIANAKEITGIINEGKKTERTWSEKDTKDYDKIRKSHLNTAGQVKSVIKRLSEK